MHQTRSQNLRGSTRLFLVGVLVAAAVLLGASLLVILQSDDSVPEGEEGVRRAMVPGTDGGARSRDHSDPDWDDEGEYDDDGVIEFDDSVRPPHGPEFIVTAETIRKAIKARHWEEIRRMIDVFQKNGHEVPLDIVESLIAFFDGEDTRLDAVLALGQVKSDAAGIALAERAGGLSYPIEVRQAALQALSKNGNASALATVRALATDPTTDPKLLRYAFMALGGIGGQDATLTLISELKKHQDSGLSGVVIQALGKSDGAGGVMAQTIRSARDNGDEELVNMMLRAAHINGESAGDEVRAEIRRLIEDPSASEFVESREHQLGMRGSALAAASAIGGNMLDPVIAVARDDTEGLGGIALHSLRQARGDEAARKLATLLQNPRDETVEREVAAALGETRSFEAAPHLVRLLDSETDNTRRAAAQSLSVVRSPDSMDPILQRIDDETDFTTLRYYVDALGRIGRNDALTKLEELRDSDEQRWKNVNMYVRRAIYRIKSGNPDASRMD